MNTTRNYLSRLARADQYPAGINLQDAARDSVLRYTEHFGLRFRWVHDQRGELWRRVRHPDGSFESQATGIPTFRSEVEILESVEVAV